MHITGLQAATVLFNLNSKGSVKRPWHGAFCDAFLRKIKCEAKWIGGGGMARLTCVSSGNESKRIGQMNVM